MEFGFYQSSLSLPSSPLKTLYLPFIFSPQFTDIPQERLSSSDISSCVWAGGWGAQRDSVGGGRSRRVGGIRGWGRSSAAAEQRSRLGGRGWRAGGRVSAASSAVTAPSVTAANLKCDTCFRVDMKHRYRRHLVRGEAESTMSKQKLQQRMREQWVHTHTHTPEYTPAHTHLPVGVFQVSEVDGRNAIVGREQRQQEEEEER